MRAIDFASRVPRQKRHALEQLLFFNGCQERVARDIVDVIDKYGSPEICDDVEGRGVSGINCGSATKAYGENPNVTGCQFGDEIARLV